MIAIGKITFTPYGEFYRKGTIIAEFTKKRKPYTRKDHDYNAEFKPIPYKLLPKRLADTIRYYESINERPPFECIEEILKIIGGE